MADLEPPSVDPVDDTQGAVVPLVEPSDDRERAVVRARLRAAMFARKDQPTRLGRFALLGRLGSGGMGVVYRAYDPQLEREVAVKLLRAGERDDADTLGRERLLREAQAMARLQHPNVVPVFEVGEHDDAIFVAMELVKGRTLAVWLEQEEPDWRAVVEMFVAAGRGLAAAHDAGVVHRDFKPTNVLVGSDQRPRVLDFGLARYGVLSEEERTRAPGSAARAQPSTLTRTGALVGTPAYMAPEQFEGETIDARTDQFSFCVALYEALFGHRPFVGDNVDMLARAVTTGEPKLPPRTSKVSRRVREAVMRGLSRQRGDRFADMRALLAALQPPLRRSTVGLLGTAGVLALGMVGFAALSSEPCAVEDATTLWNDGRAAAVAAAFVKVPPGDGVAQWADVEPRIDAMVAAWSALREQACARGDELAHKRRMCLARHRDRIEVVIALFEEGDQRVLESAAGLVLDLADLSQCAGEEPQAAAALPPAEVASDVADVRRQIARGWALHAAGDGAGALELAKSAVEEARRIGFRQAEAEALHLHIRAQNLLRERNEDKVPFAEAMALAAEASGDAQLVALAAAHLVDWAGPERAPEWTARARAALERIGGDARTEAILRWGLALRAEQEGDLETALELVTQAEALTPEGDVLKSRAIRQRGTLLARLGDVDTALAEHRRAIAYLQHHVRPTHPRIAWEKKELSRATAKSGDRERALEIALESADLMERRYGATHRETMDHLFNVVALAANSGLWGRALEINERILAASSSMETPDELNFHGDAAMVEVGTKYLQGVATDDDWSRLDQELRRCEEAVGRCENARVNYLNFHAHFLALSGRFEAAIHESDRALEIVSNDAQRRAILVNHRAFVLTLAGRARDAVEFVERYQDTGAIADGADVPTPFWGIGLLLTGQPERAIPLLEQAAEDFNPNEASMAAWGLARALARTGGEPARIEELLARAERTCPPGWRPAHARFDELLAELDASRDAAKTGRGSSE